MSSDPHVCLRSAEIRELGRDEIEANVIYDDHSAALTYTLKANSKHGLQRSNADKRRVLQIAWDNRFELFPELANTVDGKCDKWGGHRPSLPRYVAFLFLLFVISLS